MTEPRAGRAAERRNVYRLVVAINISRLRRERTPPTSCRWYFNLYLHAAPIESFTRLRTGHHRLHAGGPSTCTYLSTSTYLRIGPLIHPELQLGDHEATDRGKTFQRFHPPRATIHLPRNVSTNVRYALACRRCSEHSRYQKRVNQMSDKLQFVGELPSNSSSQEPLNECPIRFSLSCRTQRSTR